MSRGALHAVRGHRDEYRMLGEGQLFGPACCETARRPVNFVALAALLGQSIERWAAGSVRRVVLDSLCPLIVGRIGAGALSITRGRVPPTCSASWNSASVELPSSGIAPGRQMPTDRKCNSAGPHCV
ncbi:hypothetical protein [Nocardia arthritidis]|uniref:Uncharacterized protein n=1 Tax=Nocardia arthritidis TaxID=228602 RepID=A0A6G9YH07_9NOCA|nr:hypothetical protein [Nocardia arthritidis]QIS12430.1 hypothetical protein F5544_22845 [Nocardia arthritidis]